MIIVVKHRVCVCAGLCKFRVDKNKYKFKTFMLKGCSMLILKKQGGGVSSYVYIKKSDSLED